MTGHQSEKYTYTVTFHLLDRILTFQDKENNIKNFGHRLQSIKCNENIQIGYYKSFIYHTTIKHVVTN